jgi:hypothetical protein
MSFGNTYIGERIPSKAPDLLYFLGILISRKGSKQSPPDRKMYFRLQKPFAQFPVPEKLARVFAGEKKRHSTHFGALKPFHLVPAAG